MEFKELKQTIVRKDEEIQKYKDEIKGIDKMRADDEMEWEDQNC